MSHLTKEDVDRQIQADYQRFYESPCDYALPNDLIEKFKKAIFYSASVQHQIAPKRLNEILETPVNMLNMVQVGIITNLLVNVPMYRMCTTEEEAIKMHSDLYDLKTEYNKNVDKITKQLAEKTNRLYKLAGVNAAVSYRPQDNLQLVKK